MRAELDGLLAPFHESGPNLLARIVELRLFGDLSSGETARVLACSTASLTRGRRVARMLLVRGLEGADN